jgi:hypothetical protein
MIFETDSFDFVSVNVVTPTLILSNATDLNKVKAE